MNKKKINKRLICNLYELVPKKKAKTCKKRCIFNHNANQKIFVFLNRTHIRINLYLYLDEDITNL